MHRYFHRPVKLHGITFIGIQMPGEGYEDKPPYLIDYYGRCICDINMRHMFRYL